jgi:hypothetical protein
MGGLTTHRLFIEYDRETTEIVKIPRVLIEPKLVVTLRISGTLKIRPEPSTGNPLVAGSSPARPTSSCVLRRLMPAILSSVDG